MKPLQAHPRSRPESAYTCQPKRIALMNKTAVKGDFTGGLTAVVAWLIGRRERRAASPRRPLHPHEERGVPPTTCCHSV